MPRGCVTVMERGGYAANGIKHCVRPVDMTGIHATNGHLCCRPITEWVSPEFALVMSHELWVPRTARRLLCLKLLLVPFQHNLLKKIMGL